MKYGGMFPVLNDAEKIAIQSILAELTFVTGAPSQEIPHIRFLSAISDVVIHQVSDFPRKYWIGPADTPVDINSKEIRSNFEESQTSSKFYTTYKKLHRKMFYINNDIILYIATQNSLYAQLALLQSLFELKYYGKTLSRSQWFHNSVKVEEVFLGPRKVNSFFRVDLYYTQFKSKHSY